MTELLTDAQLERKLKTALTAIEALSAAASQNELALAMLFRVAAYAHYSVADQTDLLSRIPDTTFASFRAALP